MNFRKSRSSRSKRNSTTILMDATEKWRAYNKRVSKRESEYYSEDSDDDQPKLKIKNWEEELFGRRSIADESDQDIEVKLSRKQTLILSTLLPDEILLMDSYDVKDPKRFVGVLLMADVSGYTALSEHYNNTGKGGTCRLTATLNAYLGSLIEIIYSHGGDIIKFAGDAFLALWKTDIRTFLTHTIHSVIACALVIQHSYAKYETDVKVNLRVKLAISAGNLMFSPIGSGIDMNYVIFGLPVLEAKLAESVCASGEVKLAPSAWAHCYSRNYDYSFDKNGHITIKAILYDCHDNDVHKPYLGFGAMLRQVKKPYNSIPLEHLSDHLWDSPKNLGPIETLKKVQALNLRKAVLVAEEKNIGSEIRRFMIRPVLTQIDAHQPLEYLTEMRQVSIVFITFKPRECPPAQFVTIVNNSYQITCEIVYKSMGCVNKVILFDKDVMILVIFGLRGFKHESEAQAALKCGYSIRKSVSALDGVLFVSIGVTTGQVYCGVVGHPLRREYTVIGAVVNKAARLMCYYHNKIICDETTFVKSKMSKNSFTLLPSIELKGIGNAGKIYEYTEDIRVKELYDIQMIPPVLDRADEVEYLEMLLEDYKQKYREFDALLLIGENRIGKTRLLQWMARLARHKGFHVCYVSLTSIHSANTYLALSQIMNQMLEITEPIFGFAKEEMILQLLKVYHEDLCYLNSIIKVKFAFHEAVHKQDENTRTEKAKAIFIKLIGAMSKKYVLFIDDLQNLDASSWEFISIMLSSQNIFTVLTVTRGKFTAVHKWLYSVFIKDSIRKIVLGPFASEYIPALACQILDVDAVPSDLCRTLKSKCKGMPGLLESFIVHLFSSGAIEVRKINTDELAEYEDENLQFPDQALLKPQALDMNEQTVLDELLQNNATGELNICIVIKKEELDTDVNIHNEDALLMVQIDSLTPYQQLLLKIASVIGDVLSRDLLENIMYENNPVTTAKAVKRLFAMRILACAHSRGKWSRSRFSTIPSKDSDNVSKMARGNLYCECVFNYNPENEHQFPKYAFCKLMRFRNRISRQTCYELLPINQKKEFHSRVISYLESMKLKCPECGGAVMVVESLMDEADFDSREEDRRQLATEFKLQVHGNSSSDTGDSGTEEYHKTTSDDRTLSLKSDMLSSGIARNTKSETTSGLLQNQDPESLKPINSDAPQSNLVSLFSIHTSPILKPRSEDDEDAEGRCRSMKRVTMSSLTEIGEADIETGTNLVFDLLRPIVEARSVGDWHTVGIVDSQDDINDEERTKNAFSVRVEKGMSLTNFKKCTCANLNITIYEQLVHHAKQAELTLKAIEFMIHYAYLNLQSHNLEIVFESLNDAEKLCLQKPVDVSGVMLTVFELKRFLGRIYTLRASGHISNANLTIAKVELERAGRIYRPHISSIKDMFNVRNKYNTHFFIPKMFNRKYLKNEIIMKTDAIFYLNVATVLYSTMNDDKSARLCSQRCIDLVQKVDCNLIDLCDALSNALQVDIDRGNLEGTTQTEKIVKRIFKDLQRPIQAEELYALGKLFMASFHARMGRAEIAASIRSGFRAIVVSKFLNADSVSLEIIPDLFYLLLCRRRIQEAVDVLQLIMRLAQNRKSQACETWYFALCMDLILDAGFQLESFNEIDKYADTMMRNGGNAGMGRRRLVINLWTYWLRLDSDRRAKRYETEALSWIDRKDEYSTMTTLMCALRLTEALLESLARKVDDLRKVVDLMELRSIADRELTYLEKECRIVRTSYTRWLLLKAHSLFLSTRYSGATAAYNQALEDARQYSNHLEAALAQAAFSNSRIWLLNARNNRFMHWRDGAVMARGGAWHQNLYKMTTKRE